MTRDEFFLHCKSEYGTTPDYPFDDWNRSAVFRHQSSGKWYALAMQISMAKFVPARDDIVDVVNLKLPLEMFGSFGPQDGVYPAYHMNKQHWISVVLSEATPEVIHLLVAASYNATKPKIKKAKR